MSPFYFVMLYNYPLFIKQIFFCFLLCFSKKAHFLCFLVIHPTCKNLFWSLFTFIEMSPSPQS